MKIRKPSCIAGRNVNWYNHYGKWYGDFFKKLGVEPSSVSSVQFSHLVISDSVTPWIAARQTSLSITNSWSLLKLMSIKSVMPSSHLILCHPLLLLPPNPPSIRVFSNESTLCMRWPKYWSFSFSISPSNEHAVLISFRMDWFDLLVVQGTLKSLLHMTTTRHIFWENQNWKNKKTKHMYPSVHCSTTYNC